MANSIATPWIVRTATSKKGEVIVDFKLTEEQELVRANIREFVQEYLDPIAAKIDEESLYRPML